MKAIKRLLGRTVSSTLSLIDRCLPKDAKVRAAVFLMVGGMFGLIGPWCATGILSSFQERASFPMTQQQIAWLREAGAAIPCDQRVLAYAPIIGGIVEVDRRIAHEHETQQHWYSRYFSPASWLQVELIPVPCSGP